MQTVRNAVMLGLVLGGAFLALSPKRRSARAEKPTRARRFVSRGLTDREARVSQASERWDDEGGAIPAADAQLR
jgi:hypothetical protein